MKSSLKRANASAALAIVTVAISGLLSGCYSTEPLCSERNRIAVNGLEGTFDFLLAPAETQPGRRQPLATITLSKEADDYVMSVSRGGGQADTKQLVSTCLVDGKTVFQIHSTPYQFALLNPITDGFELEQRGLSKELLRANGIDFEMIKVTMENQQPAARNNGVPPELVLKSLDYNSKQPWTSSLLLLRQSN